MRKHTNTLTFVEKEKIASFIRDGCHPIEGEEGKARYEADWNDERVAIRMTSMLDREVTSNNVQYLRDQIVGKLFEKKSNGHAKVPNSLIEKLVSDMAGQIGRLTNRVQYLEELLDKRTGP
jgi:hypothetical protein